MCLGADGVACMGFPGAACEGATMGNLARLASDCRKWGLQLLAEMIPGGFGRPDIHTPENIAMAARLGRKLARTRSRRRIRDRQRPSAS